VQGTLDRRVRLSIEVAREPAEADDLHTRAIPEARERPQRGLRTG
jgi:hypothetical protein